MASNIRSLSVSDPVATIATTWPSGSTCTCTDGTTSLSGGTSGSTTFNIPNAGDWVVSCTDGSESDSQTITISANTKTCELSYITYLPIGGRIFYDNGSNGATYKFFDSSYNEITTQTISGLANAYYYTVKGTATTNRWYVYDTATPTSNLTWAYDGTFIGVTTNSIGSGKTNTATVLAKGVPTDSYPNIWSFIKGKKDSNYNGCNDWFIASMAEQDKLISSGLVTWYKSDYIWTSVEYSSSSAYNWSDSREDWHLDGKGYGNLGFAARSF